MLHEVQYGIRRLRSSPTFTIAATLTLAITVGATASVFSLVNAVLLEPAGIPEPERVLSLYATNPVRRLRQMPTSAANYLDWQAQSTLFTGMAAAALQPVTVTGAQEPERLRRLAVTPTWFRVTGLAPLLGRTLAPDSAGPAEALISYGYWQREFGGTPAILGHTLKLDDQPYTIVGVMPASYLGTTDEVWTRLSFTKSDLLERASHAIYVYARLKRGVTLSRAREEMRLIAQRLASAYPEADKGWSVESAPVLEGVEGAFKPALMALLAAAGCVLLMGAANLANLFLVRYVAREREMAIRTALGATRGRLVRELLVEASMLGLVAGTLGIGVAVLGARTLRGLAPPWLPRLDQVGLDTRVVGFCAVTSILALLIFGVLPAWHTARGGVALLLKAGARATGSAQQSRLQSGLVVAQISIALVLLTGTGLLVESFDHFRRIDTGFQTAGTLTAVITGSNERYPTPERQVAFVTSVVDHLAAQPGVDAASASSDFPGTPSARSSVTAVGEPTPAPTNTPSVYVVAVTPDYFRTVGIALVRGRGVYTADDRRATKVGVIDQMLARQFFAGRDPIGRTLAVGGSGTTAPDTVSIVGVVRSVRQGGLTAGDQPELYVPFAQFPDNSAALEVHTSGDPDGLRAMLKRVVADLDADVPVYDVQTMNARVYESVATTQFATFLASLFAAIALLLGAVGIYSVLAYIVGQGQREIAVRIALGAQRAHVMGEVFRRALMLTTIGVALGSVAAWAVTRALASLFEGINPHDPRVFMGAAVVFAVVALAAAAIPAHRTTRVNPVVALTSS